MGDPWFFHSIRHKSHLHSQPDPNRFDRDRLFSVVARGVPEDLAGLPEYLSRTSKYLTDSEYTGRQACPMGQSHCMLMAVLRLS